MCCDTVPVTFRIRVLTVAQRGLAVLPLVAVTVAVALALVVVWHQGTLLDLRIYRMGGWSFLHHRDSLYDLRDAASLLPFTYPPFAAVVFAPLAAIGQPAGQVVLTVATVFAAARIAQLLVGMLPLGDAGRRVWLALILVAAGASEPVISTLQFGQINVILLALAAQAVLRPGSRWSAAGLGLAVGMKLTPGIFILGLLACGRWKDARRAAIVAAGTVVLGALAFPHSSWIYFTGAGFDDTRIGFVEYLPNQSLNGGLWRVFGQGGSPLSWMALGSVILIAGLWVTRRLAGGGDRLGALAAAALTGLLISPVSWTHHWVAVPVIEFALLAPMVARVPTGRVVLVLRVVLVAGWVLLTGSRIIWRVPHGGDAEYHQSVVQFLAGNSYLEWGLLTLAFLAYLARHAVHRTAAGQVLAGT